MTGIASYRVSQCQQDQEEDWRDKTADQTGQSSQWLASLAAGLVNAKRTKKNTEETRQQIRQDSVITRVSQHQKEQEENSELRNKTADRSTASEWLKSLAAGFISTTGLGSNKIQNDWVLRQLGQTNGHWLGSDIICCCCQWMDCSGLWTQWTLSSVLGPLAVWMNSDETDCLVSGTNNNWLGSEIGCHCCQWLNCSGLFHLCCNQRQYKATRARLIA